MDGDALESAADVAVFCILSELSSEGMSVTFLFLTIAIIFSKNESFRFINGEGRKVINEDYQKDVPLRLSEKGLTREVVFPLVGVGSEQPIRREREVFDLSG